MKYQTRKRFNDLASVYCNKKYLKKAPNVSEYRDSSVLISYLHLLLLWGVVVPLHCALEFLGILTRIIREGRGWTSVSGMIFGLWKKIANILLSTRTDLHTHGV